MSIIGNAILAGGGGSATARMILGAKNEVVTYAGPVSGTVTLNASGAGTLKLPNGSYQFNGGTSGYVRTVTIDSSTDTVHVRPVGTIYWYGSWTVNPQYSYTKDPGVVEHDPDTEDPNIYFRWAFPVNGTWHIINSTHEGDGYGSCTMRYRGVYSTSYARLGYGSGLNPNTSGDTLSPVFVSYDRVNWANVSFSYTAASGNTIRIYGYRNNQDYYLDVQELYLGDR